jgi:ribonucleoside-diphosphate reductase beta chain
MFDASTKRIINGEPGLEVFPLKYGWAWDKYLSANANHWTPLSTPMVMDKSHWELDLNDDQRHTFLNTFSYLSSADVAAMGNISVALMNKVTAPEIQQYYARHCFEESLHTWTYRHCLDVMGLDPADVFSRYKRVAEIGNKIQLLMEHTDVICGLPNLSTDASIEKFIHSYFFFSQIFEGILFYHGFTPIFSIGRQNKIPGTCTQLQYIMRDESMHVAFGSQVIRTITEETGVKLRQDFCEQMMLDALTKEEAYAHYILPRPLLGYNAEQHLEMFKFMSNRRMVQARLKPLYDVPKCPTPWLDELATINKEQNFFETHVTNYQVGGLNNWESPDVTAMGWDSLK